MSIFKTYDIRGKIDTDFDGDVVVNIAKAYYTKYLPKKIKMAITGNGNASKEQVAKMLQSMLKLKTIPKNLDATDGLAAAVCHFYNDGRVEVGKSYTGWSAFVKQNPKKIG